MSATTQASPTSTLAPGVAISADVVAGEQVQNMKVWDGTVGSANKLSVSAAGAAKVDVSGSAEVGAVTETAPATDTASSGLNGRLQRIAQRLTTLLAVFPTTLDTNSGNKSASTLRMVLATDQPALTNALQTKTTTTPSWTDGVAVTAIKTLAKGAVNRDTIDLTGKPGMYLTMFIGRTGTTALDVGIAVRVRRQIALSPIMKATGAPVFSATSDTAAAVSGVCAAAGNNAGVTSLTLNAAKTFVAGSSGDIILAVLDSVSAPTTASEFVRQSFATSTTVKLLDAPTISAHNDITHNVADKANMWQCWIEGGCVIEVIFDYGAATTGDTVVIGAYAQRLDSMVSA